MKVKEGAKPKLFSNNSQKELTEITRSAIANGDIYEDKSQGSP